MSLSQLNIARYIDSQYETPYCDVSTYKYLKTTCLVEVDCKLLVISSIDGKDEGPICNYQINKQQWCSLKIDISTRFLKFRVVLNDQGYCDSCVINSLGRRSLPSDIYNKFIPQPNKSQTPSEERNSGDPKKSILRNFKITKKPEPDEPKKEMHYCEKILPKLLLAGNMLYCKNNRLECLAPPPNDGRIYMLCCRDKIPQWMAVGDDWKF